MSSIKRRKAGDTSKSFKARSGLIRDLISVLEEKSWLSVEEHEELQASLSQWLQNLHIKPPFFTNAMRNVCIRFLARSYKYLPKLDSPSQVSSLSGLLPGIFDDLPYAPPKDWKFTFIDLFAGIGGFRIAFQEAGGKCVFSSEWDRFAKETYVQNFGDCPHGDIRRINKNDIPDHDILCAGFPCQPFSLAGVSKKNSLGRKHGFEDETQGTLFFEIKEILRIKRPPAFMLENVKNLLSHDKGRTFEVIRHALEDQLGYVVNWKVVNGAKWVPQHRERIFIVGYDPDQVKINEDEILIPRKPSNGYQYPELKSIISKNVKDHTLSPGTWDT